MNTTTNNLRIDINKYYFNTDGTLIDSSTLPASLKTELPWWVSGKFDYDCNYRNISLAQNPSPWNYVGVYNRTEIKFLFTGLNNVQSVMQNGDLSVVFTDNLINPSYYALIVSSSQGGGLTGVIQNVEFYSPYFDIFSDNPDDDYVKNLLFMEVSKFGSAVKFDRLPISRFYNPNTRPNNKKLFVNVPFVFSSENIISGTLSFSTSKYYIDFRRVSH